MKRSLTLACIAALASVCSLSQPLRAADIPVRNAVYSNPDATVPTVNVSQIIVGPPVAYRPYRAYYRPYRPYVAYRPYYVPVPRPYRYGAAYAPYGRYYPGYPGF